MKFNWAQAKAFASVTTHLNRGDQRLAVDMPTGSGKSYLAARVLHDCWNARPQALIMTYSKTLRRDLVDTIRNDTPAMADHVQEYVIGHGLPRAPLVVATYNSGMAALREGLIDPAKLNCIILDEGHLALAVERQKVLRELSVPQIALTATTSYAGGRSLEYAGYELVYQLSLAEAVEGRLLAPFQSCIYELQGDYPSLRGIRLTNKGDFEVTSLEHALNVRAFNAAMADLVCSWEQPDSGRKLTDRRTIAFCAGIAHAEAMARELNERMGRGFAFAVHSEMPDKWRDDILTAHRSGAVPWLLSANYLVHGHNDPQIDGVVNLAPTCSPVVAGQRPGRMMRLDANNQAKEGLCFELLYGRSSRQLLHGELMSGYIFRQQPPAKPKVLDAENASEKSGLTLYSRNDLDTLAKDREKLKLQSVQPPVLTEAFADALEQDGRSLKTVTAAALKVMSKLSPNNIAPEHWLIQVAAGQHKPADKEGNYSSAAYAWAVALTRSVDELFPEEEKQLDSHKLSSARFALDSNYIDRLVGADTDENPVEREAMVNEAVEQIAAVEVSDFVLRSHTSESQYQKERHVCFNAYFGLTGPEMSVDDIAIATDLSPSQVTQRINRQIRMARSSNEGHAATEQLREALGDTQNYHLQGKYRLKKE